MHRPIATALCMGFLVGITTVPLTTTLAVFRSIDDEGKNIFPAEDIRESVLIHHSTQWSAKRRLYSRAVEIYRDLVRKGVQGIDPPDINDIDTIMRYLDEELFEQYVAGLEEERLHGAAPMLSEMIDQLPYQEQLRLYGFAQSGRCDQSLRLSYIAGFYELCMRLVEEGLGHRPVKGLREETKEFRGLLFHKTAPQQTLKLRLQMIEEAYDRTNRRENIERQRYRYAPPSE